MKKINTVNNETTRNNFNISSYATMDVTAVTHIFKTQNEGLTTKEADDRLDEFGPNQISESYKDTVWSSLFEAIINPFNVILMVIAVITFVTDVVIPVEKDYFTFVIIILLLLLLFCLFLYPV